MSDPTRLEAASYQAAAPCTLVALHAAVKGRMEEVAAAFWGLATKTSTGAPIVVDGWLSPKTPEGEQFPFILVRPRSGVDSVQGSGENAIATIELRIGTYLDEDNGWLEPLKLIDAIRDNLGAAPTIAGTAFEHTGPLKWELSDEQPRPQWLATVETIWTLPRPARVEARNPQEA